MKNELVVTINTAELGTVSFQLVYIKDGKLCEVKEKGFRIKQLMQTIVELGLAKEIKNFKKTYRSTHKGNNNTQIFNQTVTAIEQEIKML